MASGSPRRLLCSGSVRLWLSGFSDPLVGFLGNPWTLNFGLGLCLSSIPPLFFSDGTCLGQPSRFCGPACLRRNAPSSSHPVGPNLNRSCFSLFLAGPASASRAPRGGESQTGCLQLRIAPQSCHLLSGDKKRPIAFGRCSFWQLSQPQIGQSCSSVTPRGAAAKGSPALPLRHPLEKRGSDLRKKTRKQEKPKP